MILVSTLPIGFIRWPQSLQFFESTSEDRHTCSLANWHSRLHEPMHKMLHWLTHTLLTGGQKLTSVCGLCGFVEEFFRKGKSGFCYLSTGLKRGSHSHPSWKACVRSFRKGCVPYDRYDSFCFREPPEDSTGSARGPVRS